MELRVVAGLLAFLTAATCPVIWASNENYEKSFNRSGFPLGFIFGTATSAYQVEGASKEGGRGPSIWDTFAHSHPDRIADRSNGDVADDSYHLFKEDVRLMKDIGMDAYRFSMSWPRILPNGSLSGGINKEGIQYYSNLINELLSHGLQPFVTLFHWDVPQTLEDQYGGFLSSNIVDDFHAYADICFKEFGDRVKHWITLNEPWTFASTGYAMGEMAPGRCSPFENLKCSVGDSSREPYITAHNMLLAHSAAVKLYREKYQGLQKGKIGITIVSHWFVPYSSLKSDNEAAARALDFMFGWFMDPLTEGDYPFNMRALVGNRLPQFTAEQSEMIKGSFDFLGLNYYTANYAEHIPLLHKVNVSWTTDPHVNETGERNGKLIGRRTGMDTFYVYPSGIEKLLLYTKVKYNNPIIYITENGIGELDIRPISLERALEDDERIDFHHQHLLFVQKAIRQGVKVKGYFAWSLLDNFEWNQGYTIRFGINYVDHKNGQKRYQKKSAHWFHEFLKA